jgi:hypothetical protein
VNELDEAQRKIDEDLFRALRLLAELTAVVIEARDKSDPNG